MENNENIRIDKLLSNSCIGSRSEVKKLIKSGKVEVNGEVCKDPSAKVFIGDEFSVNGQPAEIKRYIYIMMNKPSGVISSTEDSREITALSCLPDKFKNCGLFPAGRLDKDTEGFLLITNDGNLGHKITSPKFHADKRYLVKTECSLEPSDCTAFENGIVLNDGYKCLSARLEILDPNECIVTIREGKFHQIKKMMTAVGKPLIYLKRIEIGGLKLDPTLKTGEWRELTHSEVEILKNSCKNKII